MSDINLSNKASISGMYNSILATIDSNKVTTKIIDGLEIIKSVDKDV